MFTQSPRLANIFMIVTTLALCVSACSEVPAAFSSADITSYHTPLTPGSLRGLALSDSGY